MVGEQPGDQEDLSGKPFVGPAGKLLNRALQDAGIARGDTYLTNAVKHFKWEPRGQASNSQETVAKGTRRLPSMARSRTKNYPTEDGCLPRRYGNPRTFGPKGARPER